MRRWLGETTGGLPRIFWALWTAMLVNRIGAIAMMFLPLYLTRGRGLSLTLAGLVTAAYGIGGAGGSLLGGVLADVWGRKATLVTANGVAAVLMLALGLAHPLWMIVALTAALGVFHSMPGPAIVAATIDVVPEESRARGFNLQFWAFNLGMAVAAALGGLIVETGFFLLFALDAAITGLTMLVVAWAVPETLPPAAKGRRQRGRRPGLLTALTDPHFMAFVGLTFVLAFLGSQNSMLQLAMAGDGLSPAAYGAVAALPGVFIVAGQLFVPRLIRDRVKGRVLALALTFLGAGYFAVTFADVLPMYLAAAAVWTIGSMLAAPPNAEVIAELAPSDLRARYQAVFYLTFPAAAFVAPAFGGWSLEHLGDWHWVMVGLAGWAAAVGHLAAGAARERRVSAALAPREGPVAVSC